jgi:D-sedoheptulose 7-phosphate isomerase
MPLSILEREKTLAQYSDDMLAVFRLLCDMFENGGRLFICGNGGSFADSIHIVGELVKSFEKKRPLPAGMKKRFEGLYGAEALTEHLELGLPSFTLGTNPSLTSALLNDVDDKEILFAQELFVNGRAGDALIGISTSGNARDVLLAVSTARALNIRTVGLTGRTGGKLRDAVDRALVVNETTTREVQQVHQVMYHTLCRMLEEHFYG